MSQAFDKTIFLLLALAACTRAAAEVLPNPECERSVCRVQIDNKHQISLPCEGNTLALGYSQSGGATVIQCANPSGTAEENPLLLFDRHDATHAAYEFSGGRLLTPNADDWEMFQTEGVPDKFGPKPLCHAGSKPPGAGEFLIGVKQVQTGDHPEAPYCFELFLVSGGSNWSVAAFSQQPVTPASATELSRWQTLVSRLTALVAPFEPLSPATATARISVARATLYPSPDGTPSKMYLVQGDRVEIRDPSKRTSGWLLIRYITKTGRTVEKWLRTSDVEFSGK